MIDTIVNVLKGIINLLKDKKENDRNKFKEFIEPLFLDMTEIHRNYMETFEELENKLLPFGLNPESVYEIVKNKKLLLEHLRIKVHSFGKIILTHEDKNQKESINAFAKTCLDYFTVETGLMPWHGHYRGYFTDILEFMNEQSIQHNDNIFPDDNLWEKIRSLSNEVRLKWSEVTICYAKAKLDLLK